MWKILCTGGQIPFSVNIDETLTVDGLIQATANRALDNNRAGAV